jgi:hypothetical protein
VSAIIDHISAFCCIVISLVYWVIAEGNAQVDHIKANFVKHIAGSINTRDLHQQKQNRFNHSQHHNSLVHAFGVCVCV